MVDKEELIPRLFMDAFACPHCGVYAHQNWGELPLANRSGVQVHPRGFNMAKCGKCDGYSIWHGHKMIFPEQTVLHRSSADLPPAARALFDEAARIAGDSPRGAAALLRLSLQLLCKELGEKGENINADIASLVAKGLPLKVQQALDVVRVVGNNAVHPGEIRIEEDVSHVHAMFGLVNMIADVMITQPRRVEAMFNSLPEGARTAIQKRDAPKS